jgi:hypothetical protein
MLEYWKACKQVNHNEVTPGEQNLYEECRRISERLIQESPLEQIDTIQTISVERDFSLLKKSIREDILNNEPEVALDRLHTFTAKFIRNLCDKHGITYDRSKSLNNNFGEYVKFLRRNNLIESPMTERILKWSISILEAFNEVRNNKSFAHDNPILNYHESLLIFTNITSIINFLQAIEEKTREIEKEEQEEIDWDNIPF